MSVAVVLAAGRFVLLFLETMGLGKSGRIEPTGKTGDGGVDCISQDPLALDHMHM